jgi:hypothetical protein
MAFGHKRYRPLRAGREARRQGAMPPLPVTRATVGLYPKILFVVLVAVAILAPLIGASRYMAGMAAVAAFVVFWFIVLTGMKSTRDGVVPDEKPEQDKPDYDDVL